MKSFKYLLLILLAVMILPFGVFAEEGEAVDANANNEVKIYFFRGEGCSHCAEAEAWFESIEAEHGQKYEIVDYEVWYNEDNSALMESVAKARGEEDQATGVPYIIIGDQSWIGFDTSYEEQIIAKVDELAAQDPAQRYDVMNYVGTVPAKKEKKNSTKNDAVGLIIIILAVGIGGAGIYYSRKNA